MRKAYNKDVWRSIWKGKKRFFSIMVITALGVGMLTGLKAACVDLRVSADQFFDQQNLFDICVVSTMGLTDEDVEVLAALDGIDAAEGVYSETVHTRVGGQSRSASVKTISSSGMNAPYLVEGTLPEQADEIAVTEKFMADTGSRIGDVIVIEEDITSDRGEAAEEGGFEADADFENTDTDTDSETFGVVSEEHSLDAEGTEEGSGAAGGIAGMDDIDTEISLEEEEKPNFRYTEYTITAVAVDAMDINNTGGAVAFRSSATEDYTFFVQPEAVDSDVYTAVYLTLSGGKELVSYSGEYEARVAEVVTVIEDQIKAQREEARYAEITGGAYEKLDDAKQEVDEKFADAKAELADAETKLADGWKELADGESELAQKEREAKEEFAKARQELADGKVKLEEGKAKLEDAEAEIAEGDRQLYRGKQELISKEAEAYAQIEAGRTKLAEGQTQARTARVQLETQLTGISGMFGPLWPAEQWDAYVLAAKQAYVPLIEAQMTGGSQSEAGAAGESRLGGGTGDVSLPGDDEAGAAPGSLADTAVQEQTAEAQNAFMQVFSQTVETAEMGIDRQIGMLDQSAPDYAAQFAALEAQKQQLAVLPAQMPQIALGLGQLLAAEEVMTTQLAALAVQEKTAKKEFAAAWQTIADSEARLIYGKQQLEAGRAELAYNEKQLADGETELNESGQDVKKQLADGWAGLADGRQELLDGEAELADGKAEYEEKRAEADEKFADARKEIEDIDKTRWYVQDRSSLSGYANIKSDAASIEAIGTVFPIVFFVVAILISLTTITRMVEEDRGLIGTYKALGFTDHEIRKKYLLYAFAASLMGGILGDICGFIVLPKIIFVIFETMYLLPEYLLQFSLVRGTTGILVFLGGIVGATAIACKAELLHAPAVLMRPKAPRSGSRVLLERIKPVWNRLSFLNKVTARNLFRYKKRLFMTVAGIMGCMALLLFGFGVKDSVADLMPRQYEQVYQYDLMAVGAALDDEKLLSYVENDERAASFLNIQVENVKLINSEGREEKVQMIVVPDGASLDSYITLYALDGQIVELADGGIYVTQNAANVLDFKAGDSVALQNMNLNRQEAQVQTLVKNYLGNNVYLTQSTYEKLFGELEPNGVLVNLSESCEDPAAYGTWLGQQDGVISSVCTAELREEFSSAFALINMVVYLVIVMAAGLAFAVLFTLSATNISERNRELATIKVLGFFDREVHLYVNKETVILTGIGILLGIPLGCLFAQTLTYVLNMPSIYLAASLHGVSYAIAAGLSFVFALIVNLITNRTLDGIDPVEALKSIE